MRFMALSSAAPLPARSEEHTSELQSRRDLVCRLLLEKKNRAFEYAAGFGHAAIIEAQHSDAVSAQKVGQNPEGFMVEDRLIAVLGARARKQDEHRVGALGFRQRQRSGQLDGHLGACGVFFFNDPATTEIYTLSLHDALPISWGISSIASSQAAPTPTMPGTFNVPERKPCSCPPPSSRGVRRTRGFFFRT